MFMEEDGEWIWGNGGDGTAPFFAYTTVFEVMSRCAENHIGSDSVDYYTSLDMGYSLNYRLAY